MGALATITSLLYLVLVIAFFVWLVRLANRFVGAHEQSARAMQRIAQAAEQLAQAGLPAARDERP
jgi:endoglucanase Acf2